MSDNIHSHLTHVLISHLVIFLIDICIDIILYRDSLSRCGSCTNTPGCRFCLTTFQCMDGTYLEPTGIEGSACDEWALEPSSCPKLNDCGYTSCDTCSRHKGCTWCGSLDRCIDDSDTNFVHCQGKVRPGEICPHPFTSVTHVEGNLVVRGDADLGGGVLQVSGPCNIKDGCYSEGFHSRRFDVKSAGFVAISAANTDSPNVQASEILLQSGSGTNKVGGSGGDFLAFAGDAAGGKYLHPIDCITSTLIVSHLL